MNPLHVVAIRPGKTIVSGQSLTISQFLIKWLVDIGLQGQVPSAIATAYQDIPGLGVVQLYQWQLEPAYQLQVPHPLVVAELGYGADLLIEAEGFGSGRLLFFPYPVPPPLRVRTFANMSISPGPYVPPVANSELTSTAAATAAAAASFPANPLRLGGYIENLANRPMWVKWSSTAAASAAAPNSQVPANGNIDIPENYVGGISIIWSAGVATTGQAVLHEAIP
jgi:hypothetical protein